MTEQTSERRNLADADLTRAVEASFDTTPGPRLRAIMQALVRHLHGFASEVQLTEDVRRPVGMAPDGREMTVPYRGTRFDLILAPE